jgi:cation transport ATPase
MATLVGGYPRFKEAFKDLSERRMTMALSATIALIAALVIRDVFTALVITAGLLGARVLEALAVLRGRRAIRGLLDGVIDPLALAEDVTSRFNTPPAV